MKLEIKLKYLDGALSGDDTVYGRFCERIESPVGSPHEIGFQQIATVAVVFEFSLIELER